MKDQIVSLAKELIKIPSVSGENHQAVEILELIKKQLPDQQFTPFVSHGLPSLLYSNKTNSTKNFKIILNAHMDVVPGSEEQFHPYEKEGKLYGRGAFDTKAAGAAMILLFKNVAHKLSYPIGLQIPTDEEISGNGTNSQLKQGIRAEFAIMAECNSNFKVTNQAKGRKWLKIITKGSGMHSAYPWHGDNAIWKMYQVLEPILKEFPIPTEETTKTTVSVTKIETNNQVINRIPHDCIAYVDIRFAKEDEETIIDKIRSLLPPGVLLEDTHMHHFHYVDKNNTYITQLQKATTEITGKNFPLRSAHATSDATFFSKFGCQAIEFGPIGDGAHHDNEWVDTQSLEEYYRILERFLLSLEK